MRTKMTRAPKLAKWLFDRVVNSEEKSTIVGDIEEFFCELKKERGAFKAKAWFWLQILAALPMFIKNSIYWRVIMFQNIIKITFRNITKHKAYYFINVTGLSIGIVCFILIALFITDELSYDRYHEKANRIYKAGVRALWADNEFHACVSPASLSRTLVAEFPEVEVSTRLRRYGFPVVRYKDKVFSEERWYWADGTFFDVFTVPVLQGDPKTALTKPNSVVVTESMARKYFGAEDPLGKSLNTDNRRDYQITGVIEDVPRNSHVHYDFLASFITIEDGSDQNWISNNFPTYFVLKEGISHKEFETKLQLIVEKYVAPQLKTVFGATLDEMEASGGSIKYFITPLTDIHLHSHLRFEHEPNSDIAYVYIFTVVAFAILLIACVNFVNLATARSATRAKEVGVRKTVGSKRGQLIRQFLAETVVLGFLATLVAIPIIEFMLPFFNNLTGKNLSVPYLENMYMIPVFLGIALFVGLLAGIYPAFFLASFDPVVVLKGESVGRSKRSWMRNVLVVFQFTVSVVLIIGTLVVYRQLQYIQNKNLGFNKDQVVVVKKADDIGQKIRACKQELLGYAGVLSASNSSNLIGDFFGDSLYRQVDQPKEMNQLIWRMWTDRDYGKTYELEFIDGQYFSEEQQEGRREVVLNESGARILGYEEAVGKKIIDMEGRDFTIIGVVKDFHFESLHKELNPLIIHPYSPRGSGRYLSVRVRSENIRETIAFMKKTWEKYALNQAFEYEFFDDRFARLYRSEEKTGTIFFSFSLLAIVIASLGLFGLTAFITQQKTKEVGIRKILGASVAGIIFLYTKQFARWILVSNIIAWPLAYFAMNKWLENFAYRANIGIETFVVSGLLALVIALFTVSFQSIRAAIANPVDSLRYE
ncbi:MAG: ABC transporter permease [Candidatus Aminicenantes bacterium]|jgi:putative ABC transport system permease protein